MRACLTITAIPLLSRLQLRIKGFRGSDTAAEPACRGVSAVPLLIAGAYQGVESLHSQRISAAIANGKQIQPDARRGAVTLSGVGWRLVDFDALGTADLEAWRHVQATNPAFGSPFFHPAFARAAHDVFHDVKVAVLEGEPVWFPLHVHRGVARPVGSPGSDFQGPVTGTGAHFDPMGMVRETDLRVLAFDSLCGDREEFTPFVQRSERSPFIDTTGGLDGYLPQLSKSGRDKLSRVRRMTNKASRQLGDVRLVWRSHNPALLDELIDIKRAQCRTTGAFEYFASPRRRALAHQLANTQEEGFEGVLSAVYAGDAMLAVHLGLRSAGVLHWWFPGYNREHPELAPGWIMLRELIAAAPVHGLTRLDLGRGEEDYKLRAMTGAVSVCRGEVVPDPMRRKVRSAQHGAVNRLKASPLSHHLSAAKNRALSLRDARS